MANEQKGFFKRVFTSTDVEEKREVSPFIMPPARSIIKDVTADSALGIATVFRSVNILTTGVAQLSLTTSRNGEGIPTPALVTQPDLNRSRAAFMKRTVTDLALNGNAYWYITYKTTNRTDGSTYKTVSNLEVLNPLEVGITRTSNDLKRFTYQGKTYTDSQIKHLRYMEVPGHEYGLGPIQAYRSGLRGALDLRDYSDNWLTKSGVPTGLLKTNGELDAELAKATKEQWHKNLEDGGIAVLGNGLEFQALLLNAADIQFIESTNLSDLQIARIFGIPDAFLLVNSGGSSQTYANRQELDTQFIRWSLMAYLQEIEDAFSSILPRGQEVKFDLSSFLRADDKSRYEAYKTAIESGVMTINEARELEGRSPVTNTTEGDTN